MQYIFKKKLKIRQLFCVKWIHSAKKRLFRLKSYNFSFFLFNPLICPAFALWRSREAWRREVKTVLRKAQLKKRKGKEKRRFGVGNTKRVPIKAKPKGRIKPSESVRIRRERTKAISTLPTFFLRQNLAQEANLTRPKRWKQNTGPSKTKTCLQVLKRATKKRLLRWQEGLRGTTVSLARKKGRRIAVKALPQKCQASTP